MTHSVSASFVAAALDMDSFASESAASLHDSSDAAAADFAFAEQQQRAHRHRYVLSHYGIADTATALGGGEPPPSSSSYYRKKGGAPS